jgi:hypothetical protein
MQGEDAAPVQCQLVALAGRARQELGGGEIGAGAPCVIAQVVDRLAQFRQRRRDRAPALADDAGHQFGAVALEEVGRMFEDRRALCGRATVPGGGSMTGTVERPVEVLGPGLDDGADPAAMVARVEDRLGHTLLLDPADDGCGVPGLAHRGVEVVAQGHERRRMGQVDPARVAPHRQIKIRRQRDARMRLLRQLGEARHRVGDDLVDRLLVVDDAVDKRGVGAVFEQSPHQIGEQLLMTADRRVDAAWPAEMVGSNDFVVERFAHAVQALEFPVAAVAGKLDDGRDGVRVVGRELRVEDAAAIEQTAGTGEIGDVGRGLAGPHRIAVEPALLAALHFAVPIGALDEPDHQPPPAAPGEVGEPFDQRQSALLIGLDREAEPVPPRELRGERQRFDQVERQVEPVGLLGVDRKADAGLARLAGERQQWRSHLGEHALALRHLVARVQCRQFDRDAGRFLDRAAGRGTADRDDRVFVGGEIAGGVGGGVRRFAQHVVGMTIARGLGRAGAVERFLDRAAHDELAREDAHRRGHRLAHDRLARARGKAAQCGAQIVRRGIGAHQPPGQHQRPGRRIDKD